MFSRIELTEEKKLVGNSLQMSLAENRTAELWNSFIPQLNAISNLVSNNRYSLQVYSSSYFNRFHPANMFEKWALAEVSDFENVPAGLEKFILPAGLYAVFVHKGDSREFYKTAQYIYGTWLPSSDFVLDDRPHFEVLGEKAKNNSPSSEEEVWIPVKRKQPGQCIPRK